MTVDDEILRRLDLMQATLQLAFKPQIDEAREAIRGDEIAGAILDATEEWIGTSSLQSQVADSTGKSTRSVRSRLADLTSQNVLQTRGSGSQLEYRRTGLV